MATTMMPPPAAPPSQNQPFFHQPRLPSIPVAQPYNSFFFVKKDTGRQMEAVPFDGKRMRKAVGRKIVDYNPSVISYLNKRLWCRNGLDDRAIQPDCLYQMELVSPQMERTHPISAVTTRFIRACANKIRSPVFCISWTPEGRRLVSGSGHGEFTLWNGLAFNFETILQAHDSALRAMVWSHNDLWMITGDNSGYIKYWQTNMNNVKMYQAHKDPIRGISISPTDNKFTSCSDDNIVRVWDFITCTEESILRGHGADVKCVDWHPRKGLIASGSKDNQQPIKLWDPRTGSGLTTLHGHKGTVTSVKWNQNGNWLLSSSRDHSLKLWDIRYLTEEFQTFKGHKREVTVSVWHPIHEKLFVSGGWDGSLLFWMEGSDTDVGSMELAHESMVWALAWHPLGHLLASSSNDHTTKFWGKNRPGDQMRDKYNLNTQPMQSDQELMDAEYEHSSTEPLIPGMGLEKISDSTPSSDTATSQSEPTTPDIPGLSWEADNEEKKKLQLEAEIKKIQRQKLNVQKPVSRQVEAAWRGFGMDNRHNTGSKQRMPPPGPTGGPPVSKNNMNVNQQQRPRPPNIGSFGSLNNNASRLNAPPPNNMGQPTNVGPPMNMNMRLPVDMVNQNSAFIQNVGPGNMSSAANFAPPTSIEGHMSIRGSMAPPMNMSHTFNMGIQANVGQSNLISDVPMNQSTMNFQHNAGPQSNVGVRPPGIPQQPRPSGGVNQQNAQNQLEISHQHSSIRPAINLDKSANIFNPNSGPPENVHVPSQVMENRDRQHQLTMDPNFRSGEIGPLGDIHSSRGMPNTRGFAMQGVGRGHMANISGPGYPPNSSNQFANSPNIPTPHGIADEDMRFSKDNDLRDSFRRDRDMRQFPAPFNENPHIQQRMPGSNQPPDNYQNNPLNNHQRNQPQFDLDFRTNQDPNRQAFSGQRHERGVGMDGHVETQASYSRDMNNFQNAKWNDESEMYENPRDTHDNYHEELPEQQWNTRQNFDSPARGRSSRGRGNGSRGRGNNSRGISNVSRASYRGRGGDRGHPYRARGRGRL